MKRSDVFIELEKNDAAINDFARLLSNLHYTHFHLINRYSQILEKYSLTVAQSNILGIIGHFHPKPVSLEEVKNLVLEPNSDVSRIVTRLAQKKLIKKVADPKNKRKVAIGLQPAGLRLHKKLLIDKNFQGFTRDITKQEAELFGKLLAKLRDA